MNKYVLKAMRYMDNPELFTIEEMVANSKEADAVYSVADAAAYAANAINTSCAEESADDAVDAVDNYFKATGENKDVYSLKVRSLR